MLDVRALLRADRRIAAWHFGGMGIECFIKLGIVHSNGLTHWKDTLHPASPPNPKHSLFQAVVLLPSTIQTVLNADPQFATNLSILQQPPGAGHQYPSLRYSGHNPTDSDHEQWKTAYRYVMNTLRRAFNAHLAKGWR
jgi:hypothetical protein